jgi:3-oxoadipate enol-lactonase
VAAHGIDIYVERRGVGTPLLFLNGSGQTLAGVAPLLDMVAARFDVVAHDQRGLGRTSVPPGPYTMAEYAADAAAVLDSVGWAAARVMGISFGGMVAQELAVTWPERVSRLALLCTSPGGVGGSSYPLHNLAGLPDDEWAAALTGITDTRYTPEWLPTIRVTRRWRTCWPAGAAARPTRRRAGASWPSWTPGPSTT